MMFSSFAEIQALILAGKNVPAVAEITLATFAALINDPVLRGLGGKLSHLAADKFEFVLQHLPAIQFVVHTEPVKAEGA